MDSELLKQIAVFRHGLISSLVNRKGMSRGEQKALIKQITNAEWDIPGSPRSSITRSTVLRWIALYKRSGSRIESLEPKPRKDRGVSRAICAETEAALIALRRDNSAVGLPVFVKLARLSGIIEADRIPSKDSLYRLFKRHGLDKDTRLPEDRRRFETELVNDLWQSDCMHGPRVMHDGKFKKSYLFAVIDDHSRLITHARFYLSENLDCYRDCLVSALEIRGLPRKLYVDNGSAFRSNTLKYACARLGVALLHARPYTPEGKGKIERFFLTVRMQLLPLVPANCTLEKLNELLVEWLDGEYHKRIHSSTGQSPLDRYLAHVAFLRSAPKDLRDYFRITVRRKVDKDRTVTLLGKLYEAPVGLVGQTVTLLYHERDPGRIEIFKDEASVGFLTSLNANANARVRRTAKLDSKIVPDGEPQAQPKDYRGGSLFKDGGDT